MAKLVYTEMSGRTYSATTCSRSPAHNGRRAPSLHVDAASVVALFDDVSSTFSDSHR